MLKKSRSILATIARVGPRSYSHYLWDRAIEMYFESWLGVSTNGIVQLPELGIDASAGNEYGPTSYSALYTILSRCSVRPGEDVFLDVGCGKGRALIVAGYYPFRRIIGIDLSTELDSVAQENLHRLRKKLRCTNISTFICDATLYDVPHDITIIYFNYSFDGDIFIRFLSKVRQSLVQCPRRLRLICNIPIIRKTSIETILGGCEWIIKSDELIMSPWAPARKFIFYEAQSAGVDGT